MLAKAKLECKDLITTNDTALLSKVLSETGNHSLAIDLALSNNLTPAYALTRLYNIDKEEAATYLSALKPIHSLDLAQNLIACQMDLPQATCDQLIATGYSSQLVEMMLTVGDPV